MPCLSKFVCMYYEFTSERKFGGYVLIMDCLWMQIYPILYKPKYLYNPKPSFKARIKSTPLNLQTATPTVHIASKEG